MDVDRSGMLAAVGESLETWSNVENGLSMVFAVLSDIQDKFDSTLNRKAHTIFNTIISFETRLDIIDALMAEEEQLSPLELETWNRCSLRLRKLYKRRHGLAHFSLLYAMSGREQQGYLLSPFWTFGASLRGDFTTLTTAQILERRDHFEEMVGAVSYFGHQARLRRGQQQGNPKPDSPIVARFQASAAQILEERARKPQEPQE